MEDAKEETHEDYQVMRSAIRLGSLSAFLVGALIVFFTFRVVVEERKREIALLRSLGAVPRQIAAVFLLEAIVVGLLGAILGFLIAPPLALAAAALGITTTGRSTINWVWFPWRLMLAISALGAVTAVLGVVRPLIEVLRLDVAFTLRPQFLAPSSRKKRSKTSGVALITLPFMAILYILIRPFFFETLPSLAFFVLESGLVCAGFLSVLVLVPEIVRGLGTLIGFLLPKGSAAPRLLALRRIERMGHEFSWAVSGVMLVFALLLALHVVTHGLKLEVTEWAMSAIRDKIYVYARGKFIVPEASLRLVPEDAPRVRFSGRTPWPNSLIAVAEDELARFVSQDGPEAAALARALGPGKTILSKMMAKRFGLGVGDELEVESKRRSARLRVAAVSDEVGYMPMVGPYRNSKTYALISSADYDLIAPYAAPIGSGVAIRTAATFGGDARSHDARWGPFLENIKRWRGLRAEVGSRYEKERIAETNRDFAIFDVILLLTCVLASVGVANNLVLSAHARRREIALYRVLGMEARQIRALFIMEGAFIGVLGGALAVALGVPLGLLATNALEVISAFSVTFDLPVSYVPSTIVGAIAISVLSSLYPAARAAGLSSAESVHYE